MKVLLFVCMLAILLFLYSMQEEPLFTGGKDGLYQLKYYHEEASRFSELRSKLKGLIDARKEQISSATASKNNPGETNPMWYDVVIERRTEEKMDYENQLAYIDNITANWSKYFTGDTSIGEAYKIVDDETKKNQTCSSSCEKLPTAAPSYVATISPSKLSMGGVSTPSPGKLSTSDESPALGNTTISSEDKHADVQKAYDDEVAKYGNGVNLENPAMNFFAYLTNTYILSDQITLMQLVGELKKKGGEAYIVPVSDEINEPGGKLTINTKLADAILDGVVWKGYGPQPPALDTKNIFKLIYNETVYKNLSGIGWDKDDKLQTITYRLNLIIKALEIDIKVTTGEAQVASKAHLNYVTQLRNRLLLQYDSPTTPHTKYTTLKSAFEKNLPEVLPS